MSCSLPAQHSIPLLDYLRCAKLLFPPFSESNCLKPCRTEDAVLNQTSCTPPSFCFPFSSLCQYLNAVQLSGHGRVFKHALLFCSLLLLPNHSSYHKGGKVNLLIHFKIAKSLYNSATYTDLFSKALVSGGAGTACSVPAMHSPPVLYHSSLFC